MKLGIKNRELKIKNKAVSSRVYGGISALFSNFSLLTSNYLLLLFLTCIFRFDLNAASSESMGLHFSNPPTDLDFFQSHVFEEPLIPIGGVTSADENKALAQALLDYQEQGDPEKTEPITSFLETHPNSVWRVSLLTNLGIVYDKNGWFSKALNVWEKAWKLSKNETDLRSHAIADRAVGELADLYSKLGKQKYLEQLLAELKEREVMGSVVDKIADARAGLWRMKNQPETTFRCGAFALGQISASQNPKKTIDPKIINAHSSDRGMSLNQIAALAKELNMNYQMVFRAPGNEVILPSLVHWKVGHYAALIQKQKGRFLVQDSTFGGKIWMSLDALEAESSGYFLIPDGKLPPGYRPVNSKEAGTIFGKGTFGCNRNTTVLSNIKCKPSSPCKGKGMAVYNFETMFVTLNITDIPVGYTPPRGPDVHFIATYNQHEANQPGIFTYSNLGPKWTFRWLSYIQDNPNNELADAQLFMQGGGAETYTGFDIKTQSYGSSITSLALLIRTSPTSYERQLPDGSKEIFNRPDGANAYPRKIFLTQIIDPQGNKISFVYDADLRMTQVVDVINQKTSIQYVSDDPNDPSFYLVKQVTDPFGRSAMLSYDNKGRLVKITDVIGISSSFNYVGSFINKLITPYGATTFDYGENGIDQWLEVTDPQGSTERAEFHSKSAPGIPSMEKMVPQGIPTDNNKMDQNNSFYWDKKAMKEHPGDYTQAQIYHWLNGPFKETNSRILASEKKPLESRIWYYYPGQKVPGLENPEIQGQPSHVARVLDDGSTQLDRYEYNDFGIVTKHIDPIGRQTVYVYAPNQLDLLEVQQGGNVLAKYTYNDQHLPLTTADAAGQITTFIYNNDGQLTSITNPKGEITTRIYDNQGYLTAITGPDPKSKTIFAYDSFGRVVAVTDSEGYQVKMGYDAMNRRTKVTYPDQTTEEIVYNKLDPVKKKDRLNRWTSTFYNAMRQVIAIRDPEGQVTNLQWCKCGALDRIVDPLGDSTQWKRDVQGRAVEKIYPDGSKIHYVYENSTSRIKSIKDPKGQITNYQYNKDDTIQQVSYSNATIVTPTVNFEYDPNFNRITKMTDGTGVTTYNYNPIEAKLGSGMLGSIIGSIPNSTIAYVYDELGRVKERGINGVKQSAVFDSLGRVTKITNALGDFINDYVNATGRLKSITYPNKQSVAFDYFDNSGDQRLKEIKNLDPAAKVLSKFNYAFNAVGNITSWVQQADLQDPKTYTFGYDQADQLTGVNVTDSNFSLLTSNFYSYDKAGNRLSEQIDTKVTLASFNNLNQLIKKEEGAGPVRFEGNVNKPAAVDIKKGNTTIPANVDVKNNFNTPVPLDVGTNTVSVVATDYSGNKNTTTNNYKIVVTPGGKKVFKYDANGNLTEISIPNSQFLIQYAWDAVNRLVKVTQGMNVTEFLYDGLGRRVAEKLNGVVIKRWVWCGTELCEERDVGGAVTKRFYPWGMVIVSGVNIGSYFYTWDHLGSIRDVTDNTGVVKARYEYDSYGRRTLVSGTDLADFGYTGYYYHKPSGLNLAVYRAYDSDLGRFISRDPIEEEGGLDLYRRVGNNVINKVDLLGLAPYQGDNPPGHVPWNTAPFSPSNSPYGDSRFLGMKLTDISNMFGNNVLSNCIRGCLASAWDPKCKKYIPNLAVAHARCFAICFGSLIAGGT